MPLVGSATMVRSFDEIAGITMNYTRFNKSLMLSCSQEPHFAELIASVTEVGYLVLVTYLAVYIKAVRLQLNVPILVCRGTPIASCNQ
jgi:hypothetical protein